jgi:hypothetical protein
MKPPTNFTKIVDRQRYTTETATLIAGDDYWDGHNYERHGRQSFLYKTPKGAFFTVSLTQWQGEQDTLTPISLDEAIELYEGTLSEHRVDYEHAFPDVEVVDA